MAVTIRRWCPSSTCDTTMSFSLRSVRCAKRSLPRVHESPLRELDVLAAGTLRAVTDVEGHRLPLAELIECGARAGRLVEEVLGSVARRDKSKPFVTDEPFDGAIHRHVRSLSVCVDSRLLRIDHTGKSGKYRVPNGTGRN